MIELALSLATIIALAAISSAQPFLSRPELFFAVTVTAEFRHTEAARRVVRHYRFFGWSGTIVAVLLLWTGFLPPHIAVFVTLTAWVLAFLVARRSAWSHRSNPTSVREASLADRGERFPGGIALIAGPFVILALKAAYVHQRWDQIPERFPVHWGLNGPDRWTERTALTVYGSIGSVALMCALMLAISYATLYASRKISTTSPAGESEHKFRYISVLGLVVLAYAFAIVLPPISGGLPEIPFAPFVITAVVALFIGALIWLGQGGTRLRGYEPVLTASAPRGDRTPDECWKLGMIYYNPDDPALVVEKRFGIGWTLNFGNRWCWIVLPTLIGLPFIIRLMTG